MTDSSFNILYVLSLIIFVLQNVPQTEAEISFPSGNMIGYVVGLHNHFRRNVNPSAADMTELIWNRNLALLADKVAMKCEFELPKMSDYPEIERTGVNIGYAENEYEDIWALFTESWFDHSANFNFLTHNCTREPCMPFRVGMYAHARHVGCSSQFCSNVKGFKTGVIGVCIYHPSFQVFSSDPYKIGSPCSMCNSHFPTCNRSLCVPAWNPFGMLE